MASVSFDTRSFARQEDLHLITGQGQFTADQYYPNMLHMAVIRSVHAHAKILSMDLSAVKAAPGVK